MEKTIEQLTTEIEREKTILEDKAFELYCKDEIKHSLDAVASAKCTYNGRLKDMKELTIESLKSHFEKGTDAYTMSSIKKKYIKIIQGPEA